jgi:hypothetical protein
LLRLPDATLPLLEPVAGAAPAKVGAWIGDLDHEDFARRERATQELAKLGEWAVPALRQALAANPPAEPRHRLEVLLEGLDDRPPAGEYLRAVRVLQVLESAGTPAGRRALAERARGAPGAWLTLEAQAALRRLGCRGGAGP